MTIASNAKLRLSSTHTEQDAPPLNWLDYFGLNESPFQTSARLSMFYNLPRLQSVVDSCLSADTSHPLCLVTGMIGCGKSTLMRQMLSQIDRHAQVCAVKGGVTYSVNELLEAMTEDFCLPISSGRTIQSRLNQYLSSMDLGRQYFLIIDDAHDLPLDTLAALMHFCVAKCTDTDFVVCLFGEQSLTSRIDSLMNKRGKVNNTKAFDLCPMSLDETLQYLKFRCMKAGLEKNFPLSVNDVARIHRLSGGVPGRINRVAQQVMIDIMKREVQCNEEVSMTAPWQANPLDDEGLGLRWFAVSLFVALVCCTVWLFYGVNTTQEFEFASSKPVVSKDYIAYASSTKRQPASSNVGVVAKAPKEIEMVASSENKGHPWALDKVLNRVNNAVIQSIRPTTEQASENNRIVHKKSVGESSNFTASSSFASALQSGQGYALQILAVRNQSSIPASIKSSASDHDIHEVAIQVNGEPWKILLLGHYRSRKEAADIMKLLPAELQDFKPWVRSLASLKDAHVIR